MKHKKILIKGKYNFSPFLVAMAFLFLMVFMNTGCGFQDFTNKTAPELFLRGEETISIPVNGIFYEPGYYAFDDIEGQITDRVIIDDSKVDLKKAGSYQIIYKVIDRAGNESKILIRTVVVGEPLASITLAGQSEMVIAVGDQFLEPGFSAVDIDGSDISSFVSFSSYDLVNIRNPGLYVIPYEVKDKRGRILTVKRKVYVVMPDQPLILLEGAGAPGNEEPLRIEENCADASAFDPGFTALDKIKGDVTGKVIIAYDKLVTDSSVRGMEQELEYRLEELQGAEKVVLASVYRKIIIVEDATPPEIVLNGSAEISLELGGPLYLELGASATDKGASLPVSSTTVRYKEGLVVDSAVSPEDVSTKYGEVEVIYTAEDKSGNKAEKRRIVHITDTSVPKLWFQSLELIAPKTVNQSVLFGSDSAALFADPVVTDNDPDVKLVSNGVLLANVNTRMAGKSISRFYAVDSAGNRSPELIRIITVNIPPTPPLINGGFEDFGGSVGVQDEESGKVNGWYWSMEVNCRESNVKMDDTWSLIGGVFAYEVWSEFWWPSDVRGYENGKPIINDREGYNMPYCGVSNTKVREGLVSAWSTPYIMTDDEDYVEEIDVYEMGAGFHLTLYDIQIDGKNFYRFSIGKLIQNGISVVGDVTYRLKAKFCCDYSSSSYYQNVEMVASLDDTTQKFTNGESSMKTTLYRWNPNEWVEKSFFFTPKEDGTLTLHFIKNLPSSYDGGMALWIDDVTLEIIDYPGR